MVKLSSTSALVLLWAKQNCYTTLQAKEFLEQLDLKEGVFLYEEIKSKIWEHYDEVIKNRKFGIAKHIKDVVRIQPETQIIIAGAGYDPLGIELVSTYPKVTVFELDRDNMKEKDSLIKKIPSIDYSRLQFLTIDLTQAEDIYKALLNSNWKENHPTLLVFEGISYYLSPRELKKIVSNIPVEHIIIEFLNFSGSLSQEYASIAQKVFSFIQQQCNLPDIQMYNIDTLTQLLAPLSVKKHLTMSDLEYARHKKQHFFSEENNGWIEILTLEKSNVKLKNCC